MKVMIRSAAWIVTLLSLSATLLAQQAPARSLDMRIVAPPNNQIVDRRLTMKVRTPARSNCQIVVHVDGRKATKKRCSAKRTQSLPVAVSKLKAGGHKVKVTATRGSQKKSRTITVRVVKDTVKPSTEGVPLFDIGNFDPIFVDNFDKPAPLGTMGSDSDPDKVIYTGSGGTRWVTYPKTYLDTIDRRPYRSESVLSVHDGVLDFWLHNVDGKPAGASPSPLLDGASQYQTYGRYSVRIKVDNTDLPEYYMAWLLWPKKESDWSGAESDFPEGQLSIDAQGVQAFTHIFGQPTQRHVYNEVGIHDWHTYTQTWTPVARSYAVDGQIFAYSPNNVYGGPERWQLQTETKGDGTHSGHLLVDWAAVYNYSPP